MKECGQTEATMGLDGTGWDGMRQDRRGLDWIGGEVKVQEAMHDGWDESGANNTNK